MERIGTERRAAAAETLAKAFWNDPLLEVVLPDEAKRATHAAWFMGMPLEIGLRWGEVWAAEDTSAVAVWLTPGAEVTFPRMLQIGLLRVPLKLGVDGMRRFMAMLGASEPFHKQVEGPHWYLLALGTRPDRQGQGLGGALVDAGLAKADAAGVPTYLETATDSNIAFYRKRGFEPLGQASVYGHTVTGMVRAAR